MSGMDWLTDTEIPHLTPALCCSTKGARCPLVQSLKKCFIDRKHITIELFIYAFMHIESAYSMLLLQDISSSISLHFFLRIFFDDWNLMCFMNHFFQDWTNGHLAPFVEQQSADSSVSVSQSVSQSGVATTDWYGAISTFAVPQKGQDVH